MPHSTYRAFYDSPKMVMDLAKANLATYAAAIGTELGIDMPVIPADAFFDYDPGPLVSLWRFQVFSEDGPLDITSVEVVKSDNSMLVGIVGVNSDLGLLSAQVKAYVVAIVRMLADEAARNDEFVTLSRATLSLPLQNSEQHWFSLAGGVKVLVRSAEGSA
jgi:hypothetical protein